ncbi:hypothetical protein [Methanospirillum sp.]|uniref:hypothetical protein n=1 Tax=Methanospirillum sp. TaxID=45200 RepID=UPI0035A0BFE2
MSLEEKIASLTPEKKAQVEDYVDFLLSRSSGADFSTGSSLHAEYEEEHEYSYDLPRSVSPALKTSTKVKDSAGIITAEELLPADDPDYIDFADINSRFGHIPKKEEKKEPGRLKRFLDWM